MIHNSFYFILGRENKISQIELQNVLANFDFGFSPSAISILSQDILEIKLEGSTEKIASLIDILGGTVKIYQKIAPGDTKIASLLQKENISKKIVFGLSNYQKENIDTFRLAIEAKKTVGRSLRVIEGNDSGRLSSAQSFQYGMDLGNLEYGLFATGIGRLIAVQNIDQWTLRDFGKPRSDPKSGMLPPKLARMMVNLAISNSGERKPLVVDPFCGSGNLLMEALSMGCDVIGSDISEKAVADTKANIDWLIPNKKLILGGQKLNANISQVDATKYDFAKIDRVFVVAAESFLGDPRRSKLRIEEEEQAKKEISELYLNFLKNLKLTIKNEKLKAICLVFPLFELANGKQLSIYGNCVDTLIEIGYTTICPPLVYGRDYQVVKREIVLLKLSA